MNLKMHTGQKIVLHDPHRFRVVVAGRRWGKTQTSRIAILIAAAAKKNQIVWYVSPTYSMSRQNFWGPLKAAIPRAWIKKNGINETRMEIQLINGSIIALKGADNPDSLRGIGLDFLVMDEAQDIKQETWEEVLRPTLSTTGGRALFIGTPKSFNWFYDLWQNGQRGEYYKDPDTKKLVRNDWKSWQFPSRTSPFIPPAEIEAARRDMDVKSFRQEFEACHLPETEVLMFDGRKVAIKDVRPGDFVAHLDDGGILIPAEVIKLGETGTKTICDVVLETGEVVSASAHHKFKVYRDAA